MATDKESQEIRDKLLYSAPRSAVRDCRPRLRSESGPQCRHTEERELHHDRHAVRGQRASTPGNYRPWRTRYQFAAGFLAIEKVEVKAICDLVPEKGCASAEGGHRSGPARASRLQQGRVRLQEFEPARTRHRLYSNLLKLACSRISPCMDVSFAAKCRHCRPPPQRRLPVDHTEARHIRHQLRAR